MNRVTRAILDFFGWDLQENRSQPPSVHFYRNVKNEVAILFLHGFNGHITDTWGAFPERLSEIAALHGWDIVGLDYPSALRVDVPRAWAADPPIETLSRELRTTVTNANLSRYKCFAIVAHSMGGLVAQHAMLDESFARRVTHLFLFGTPSGGLLKSLPAIFLKRQIRGMNPLFGFVPRLRRKWNKKYKTDPDDKNPSHNFELRVIAGNRDEFVSEKSSLAPFHDRYRRVVPGDHLSMVKPNDTRSEAIQLVIQGLTKGTAPRGPLDSASVAVEMGEFNKAIRLYASRVNELDKEAVVQYAIALDSVDRRDDAIQVLRERGHTGTDIVGTLAGRLKRRWMRDRTRRDAQEAMTLYASGYAQARREDDYEQMYYHAINCAFLTLVFEQDASKAEQWATDALRACENAHQKFWRLATEGEAYLLLGEEERALNRYDQAIAQTDKPWKLRSAYQQALYIAEHLESQRIRKRIHKVFGMSPKDD